MGKQLQTKLKGKKVCMCVLCVRVRAGVRTCWVSFIVCVYVCLSGVCVSLCMCVCAHVLAFIVCVCVCACECCGRFVRRLMLFFHDCLNVSLWCQYNRCQFLPKPLFVPMMRNDDVIAYFRGDPLNVIVWGKGCVIYIFFAQSRQVTFSTIPADKTIPLDL